MGSECENEIEKLMTCWEQIGVKYPLYLQVQFRVMEWMPMLDSFVERWGVDCCTADISRCVRVVRGEMLTYTAQIFERYQDVTGIRKHRKWIERPSPPFPRDFFYRYLWIPKVEAFIQKWTIDCVPDDILTSLAEAKERYPIDGEG